METFDKAKKSREVRSSCCLFYIDKRDLGMFGVVSAGGELQKASVIQHSEHISTQTWVLVKTWTQFWEVLLGLAVGIRQKWPCQDE